MLATVLAVPAAARQSLILCSDHDPPAHMFPEASRGHWRNQSEPFGYAIEQAEEIASRMGLTVVSSPNTPFQRCLNLMADGRVDLMVGLLATPERREHMHMIAFRGAKPKAFYVRKDSGVAINGFDDLAGLRVGVVKGFKYFPEFDASTAFTKVSAPNVPSALRMLAAGRTDAFIFTAGQEQAFVQNRPALFEAIERADYLYTRSHPSYIAIAKTSPFADRLPDFYVAITEMQDEGRFEAIQQSFLNWFEAEQ